MVAQLIDDLKRDFNLSQDLVEWIVYYFILSAQYKAYLYARRRISA